ncbi:MAG: hypothetical protein ACLFQS_02755 [Bacteroidales bacterium]
MNKIKNGVISFAGLLIFIFIFFNSEETLAQTSPEVLDNGTLQEQYDYLNERTNIYNNFRAIREDMFQKIRRNSLDSLNAAFNEIDQLENELVQTRNRVDSLQSALQRTFAERDEAIKNRDSLFLFGLPVNKIFYNLLLWSIIIALLVLVGILFVLFKRAHSITSSRSKELIELKSEFDQYKKSSRERFEKQSIEHFNELRKLKGI